MPLPDRRPQQPLIFRASARARVAPRWCRSVALWFWLIFRHAANVPHRQDGYRLVLVSTLCRNRGTLVKSRWENDQPSLSLEGEETSLYLSAQTAGGPVFGGRRVLCSLRGRSGKRGRFARPTRCRPGRDVVVDSGRTLPVLGGPEGDDRRYPTDKRS